MQPEALDVHAEQVCSYMLGRGGSALPHVWRRWIFFPGSLLLHFNPPYSRKGGTNQKTFISDSDWTWKTWLKETWARPLINIKKYLLFTRVNLASKSDQFLVTAENVACGSSGVTCTKSVFITVGPITIQPWFKTTNLIKNKFSGSKGE